MAKPSYKLNWSDEAKADLKEIYNFIKEKSEKGAENVITDIRKATKTVHFSEQYSTEEYFPECRRIVVRNYKILYTMDVAKKILSIVAIFDTRQDPKKLSKLKK